ncbi:protein of unknown function [Pseudodesulfovibrio profundus]|uniref:Uncharacterized protein n=1 Tax=Pseudodesulfovibrio profundus TaxID=57320 RepID=A0A2C8F5M4_9BACT|nr:hypothetical protein [Pseudodesulfovibrio profundus]SOB58019.1 protein of unknown function [Pseudodesulfovibrio profundus]
MSGVSAEPPGFRVVDDLLFAERLTLNLVAFACDQSQHRPDMIFAEDLYLVPQLADKGRILGRQLHDALDQDLSVVRLDAAGADSHVVPPVVQPTLFRDDADAGGHEPAAAPHLDRDPSLDDSPERKLDRLFVDRVIALSVGVAVHDVAPPVDAPANHDTVL